MATTGVLSSSQKGEVKLVVVAGNIGAGKSSVLRELAVQCAPDSRIQMIHEPVEEWEFYMTAVERDPERFSFHFQLKVLCYYQRVLELCHKLQETGEGRIIFIERSPLEAVDVFMSVNRKSFVDKGSYEHLQGLFRDISRDPLWENAHYVWVDAPTDVCMRRTMERGREGELNISRSYLEALEYRYNVFFDSLHPGRYEVFYNIPMTRGQFSDAITELIFRLPRFFKHVKRAHTAQPVLVGP